MHITSFDLDFLITEVKPVGLPPAGSICTEVTDTLVMAKAIHPGKKNPLKALCEKYGIDYSNRTSVGNLLDMELLGEIYLAMYKKGEIKDKKGKRAAIE